MAAGIRRTTHYHQMYEPFLIAINSLPVLSGDCAHLMQRIGYDFTNSNEAFEATQQLAVCADYFKLEILLNEGPALAQSLLDRR